MEEEAAAVPPGGVIAIMSNLMNARRWVHASPSFVGFDLGRPGRVRPGGAVHPGDRGGRRLRGPRAPGHHPRADRRAVGEVVFTGGAAKGRLWPQIMADVLGVPVHIPAVTESSALGAALCAGTGAGLYSGLHRAAAGAAPPGGHLRAAARPRWPRTTEKYASWREVYQRMLDITDDGLLSPLWRAAGASGGLS